MSDNSDTTTYPPSDSSGYPPPAPSSKPSSKHSKIWSSEHDSSSDDLDTDYVINKTCYIGAQDDVNTKYSKPWVKDTEDLGAKAGHPKKRVKISKKSTLDAYHDDEIDWDVIEILNDDQANNQWDPNSNHQRAADRHVRNYITNRSVNRHVYNTQDEPEISEEERLILYKWTEAVLLEIQVAQSIAGAATMLSLDQVMVPVYNAIPTGNEIITYDVLKKNATSLMELQIDPLKVFMQEYRDDPMDYKRKIIAEAKELRRNNVDIENVSLPGAVNLKSIDLDDPNPSNLLVIDFDYVITKKTLFNVNYLKTLAEQYIKAQKKLRTLSPIAWNSLDDTLNMVEDVFESRGFSLSRYICADPRKLTTTFKLSRREFITLISRHPLLHSHICKAAGANLQATLNLRDGSYSSLRKYNANDTRTLVYIFRTKHEVRKNVDALKELLDDIMQKPMLYMEYFLDTTKGIQQSGFQKWLIDGNEFPNVANAQLPNRNVVNIVPEWFRNFNINSGMPAAISHLPPLQREKEPPSHQTQSKQNQIQNQIQKPPESNSRLFKHNNFVSSFEDMIRRNRSGGN